MPRPSNPSAPAERPQRRSSSEERLFQATLRLVMAGMKPLSVEEIEQGLARFEPPTALPGVRRPPPDRDRQERRMLSAISQAVQANRGTGQDDFVAPGATQDADFRNAILNRGRDGISALRTLRAPVQGPL